MTQKKDATRSEFQAFARRKGATELMMPAEIVFMEKLPLLGTGKIDNMAVRNSSASSRRRRRLRRSEQAAVAPGRLSYFRRNSPRRPPSAGKLPAGFWMITSPCPVGNSRTA